MPDVPVISPPKSLRKSMGREPTRVAPLLPDVARPPPPLARGTPPLLDARKSSLLPPLSARGGTGGLPLSLSVNAHGPSAVNGHIATASEQERLERQAHAATRLQSAWRSKKARREVLRRRKLSRQRRKEAFNGRHGVEEAEEFRRQIAVYAKMYRESNRHKRFVLHPRRHKRLLSFWDLLTTLALVYTATLTPFEVAFIPPMVGPAAFKESWYLMNRVLDGVFLVDMGIQFVLAFEKQDARGLRQWVDDRRVICRNYLMTWFGLDAATLFVPAAFDLYMASESGATDLANVSILRVLRVLRLIKVVRLVRATRIYRRWKSAISLSYGLETLCICIGGVLLAAHWYGCIIALEASLHSAAGETWLGPDLYGLCNEDAGKAAAGAVAADSAPLGTASFPQEPGPRLLTERQGSVAVVGVGAGVITGAPSYTLAGCEGLSPARMYFSAVAWSTMVITGTGGTDFYPSGNSLAETIVVTCLVLVGAFLWTTILAKFCDVATNSDPALTAFRQRLDDLNYFIHVNSVPRDMARRLREYLHQQRDIQLREHASKAVPMLSTALQIEVVLHCHRHWLDSVWFLRGLEEICLVRIAMSMESRTLAPGEVAPLRYLYVVSRGLVLYGGRVLSLGMAWGDDVILSDESYFLPHVARAMTYADLHTLSRDVLLEIVSSFPVSRKHLRRSSIKLALRRFMLLTYRSMGSKGAPNDFLDRVHNAAASLASKQHADSVTIAAQLESEKSSAIRRQRRSVSGVVNHLQTEAEYPDAGMKVAGADIHAAAVHEDLASMRSEIGLVRDQLDRLTAAVMALTATASAAAGKAPPPPPPFGATHGPA